jgi:hypothetical protein
VLVDRCLSERESLPNKTRFSRRRTIFHNEDIVETYAALFERIVELPWHSFHILKPKPTLIIEVFSSETWNTFCVPIDPSFGSPPTLE